MKYILEIYQGGDLVNTIEQDDTTKAEHELAKIFISKEKRGTPTRISFVPYSDTMKVRQTFEPHRCGLTQTCVYKYTFEGVNL